MLRGAALSLDKPLYFLESGNNALLARRAAAFLLRFKPLFEQVQRELKSGVRQTLPVHKMDEIKLAEIQKGQFFVVGGQITYIAEVGEDFKTGYDRRDSRLRVVYDNGTESSLLMRSFQRSLYRDEAGRLITNPNTGPLFAEERAGDGR